MNEALFYNEQLVIALKGVKNYWAPGTDSMISEFHQYDGYEVRNNLLKIMNRILKGGFKENSN